MFHPPANNIDLGIESRTSLFHSRAALPSLLLSMIVHLAAALTLILLVSSTKVPSSEPDRSIEIAVVDPPRTTTVRFADKFEGVEDGSDPATAVGEAKNQPQDGGSSQSGPPLASVARSLPISSDGIASVRLPEATGGGSELVSVDSDDLLSLRGGRAQTSLDHVDEFLAAERAAIAATKPMGPIAKVSLFGSTDAEGRSFVFLIDRSKSMSEEGLGVIDEAETELVRALAQLEPTHRFQVIAYNDRCVYLKNGRMLEVTEENRQLVDGFLTGMAAFGGTNHLQGMIAALTRQPDVVFLLTDGGDPYLNDAEIDYLLRYSGKRTQFHTIQFAAEGQPSGNDFLKRLAEKSGGSYRRVIR